MNTNDLCYKCYKYGPGFYLVNWELGILETNHVFLQKGSYYHSKSKWIRCLRIIMKKKRRICDRNIHKDMQIPVGIYQTNDEIFVIVQPKNACKLESADHLWLPLIDQPIW